MNLAAEASHTLQAEAESAESIHMSCSHHFYLISTRLIRTESSAFEISQHLFTDIKWHLPQTEVSLLSMLEPHRRVLSSDHRGALEPPLQPSLKMFQQIYTAYT